MRPAEFQKVVRRLPKAPVPFPYRKDDFALRLLASAAGGGRTVRDLRRSPFSRLLSRSRVKEVLRRRGAGRVDALDFGLSEARGKPAFTLTWGQWGHTSRQHWSRGYHQMARRGLNLVVQLNLPADHVRDYRRLVKPGKSHPFLWDFHPVAEDGELTLAWARVDLDLDSREALVEELQSDWAREAGLALRYGYCPDEVKGDPRKVDTYLRYALAPLADIWAEATLAAVIWLLRGPLRMKEVFYYDYETGHLIKNGCPRHSDTTGPRSLYTDLPKKFCFQRGQGGPRFLDRTFETALREVFREKDRIFWRLPSPGEPANHEHAGCRPVV